MLGFSDVDLEYLSTLFYNFEIGSRRGSTTSGPTSAVTRSSRGSRPRGVSALDRAAGKSGLCVEVTCRQGDERWQAPERLTDQVVADLVRTEMISSASDIERVHVEAVPFTYYLQAQLHAGTHPQPA